MDQEMRFHLESVVEDLVKSGVSSEGAERRARLEFAGIEIAQEYCREAKGMHAFDQLREDVSDDGATVRRPEWETARNVPTRSVTG